MELQVLQDKELKQQPSFDSKKAEREKTELEKAEQEQLTKKPRLTLKFLNELIGGLQLENFILTKRIDELEHQFANLRQVHEEAAAAAEMQSQQEVSEQKDAVRSQEDVEEGPETLEVQEVLGTLEVQEVEKVQDLQEQYASEPAEAPKSQPEPDIWQTVRIPRSERHPSRKRNSFWPFRFHHRTILR